MSAAYGSELRLGKKILISSGKLQSGSIANLYRRSRVEKKSPWPPGLELLVSVDMNLGVEPPPPTFPTLAN